MTYDLHPIFVHFPIALLLIYSVIRVLPLVRWLPQIAWKQIELLALVVGQLGVVTGLITGEIAKDLNRPQSDLVNTHATFANVTTAIYGILLLGEILAIVNNQFHLRQSTNFWAKISVWLERILCSNTVAITLAILGLIALTVTGLLGGVIVYGTSADPLAPFVLSVLGLKI